MRIPEQKIEEIREAANIVDVISDYVQLRKRGKNFIGLCPFHNEKTPSFTVSDEKQIFHCFGCHAGGNVFNFVMEYEKISFIEAVQELAKKFGITLEYDEAEVSEKQTEQEILYDINTLTARYFSDNLLKEEQGEIARNYFKNRNIKPQTMRAFGLGYSLPGWENFLNFAQKNKIDLERALTLGLVGQTSGGRLYDKFSGRIIFPIFSPNGRVVAFAGRILENKDGVAKYLNSPESIIYTKGRILYGLSHAKDEIRRVNKAILVEGYMDLISLYQNGIKNVVAVSGTALTEEQVQLLSRYTKNVVLLFDADTAGIKASMRSIEILLRRDFEIKIASVPEGEDPDSFVNKFGKDKFDDLIKRSNNFLEYQTAFYESQGMFKEPETTAEAIRELVKPLALINDELKRSLLLKSISQKFNLREKLIEAELDRAISKTNNQFASEQRLKERKLVKEEINILQDTQKKVNPDILISEKKLIELILQGNEEIIRMIFDAIEPQDFEVDFHVQIAELIMDSLHNNESFIINSLLEKINDERLKSYILEISLEKYSISKNWENLYPGSPVKEVHRKETNDTIRKFKMIKLEEEIKQNHQRMEASDNEEEIFELLKNDRELKRAREEILKSF